VKSGFRIVPLGVALALPATLVIASHPKMSFVAEKPGAGDRSETQQKSDYEKNHFYNLESREGYGDHNRIPNAIARFLMTTTANPTKLVMKKGWDGKRTYRIEHPLSSWARVRAASSTTQRPRYRTNTVSWNLAPNSSVCCKSPIHLSRRSSGSDSMKP
jgi:hypothetical protein